MSDSDPSFDFSSTPDDLDFSATAPKKTGLNGQLIVVIALGVLVLGAIITALVFLVPGLHLFVPKPEGVITRYYKALDGLDLYNPDVQTLKEFYEPGQLNISNGISVLSLAMQQSQALGLPEDVKLGYDFSELQFKRLTWEKDQATVEVRGTLNLFETSTKLSIPVPYSATHTLIWKDRHWYIQP